MELLGDSYANDGKWGGSTGGKHVKALHGKAGVALDNRLMPDVTPDSPTHGLGRDKRNTGLKPKDLVGIPLGLDVA